ncbi:sodium transport system permease protein [Roseospirillum parvum]|uniref:Sodium transport system permease protein n=2 Tax=Roseospirillum parvum TaxID=83401 RepID=A0A1G7ZNW8_9PROT|nr:sodium transport system permease protein [Roseospirillum parvum]
MLAPIRVICLKELLDNLRDRRSLTVAFVYPLLGPILLGLLVTAVSAMMSIDRTQQSDITVKVAGGERAPELIAFIADQGARIEAVGGDPQAVVRDGEAKVVLHIPPDYGERMAGEGRARVEVILNAAQLTAVVASGTVTRLVRDFNNRHARDTLRSVGLTLDDLSPLEVETVNVSMREARINDFFLFMVPPFIIFTVFIGGVYLAIDTTSGERERGSLEPLLANPVSRWQVMLGKFAAALIFTLMALFVQLAAFKISFSLAGAGPYSLAGRLEPMALLGLVAVCLPLIMFATAIQIIIATITRSFKEAQTWLGLMPLVPAMPGLAMVFVPVNPELWMMAIPTYGQTLLMGQLVRGDPVSTLNVLVAGGATMAVSALLLWLCARLYARETLLWGA